MKLFWREALPKMSPLWPSMTWHDLEITSWFPNSRHLGSADDAGKSPNTQKQSKLLKVFKKDLKMQKLQKKMKHYKTGQFKSWNSMVAMATLSFIDNDMLNQIVLWYNAKVWWQCINIKNVINLWRQIPPSLLPRLNGVKFLSRFQLSMTNYTTGDHDKQNLAVCSKLMIAIEWRNDLSCHTGTKTTHFLT